MTQECQTAEIRDMCVRGRACIFVAMQLVDSTSVSSHLQQDLSVWATKWQEKVRACEAVCVSRERGLGLQELVLETLPGERLASKLRTDTVKQRLDARGVHSIAVPHPHMPSPGQFSGF